MHLLITIVFLTIIYFLFINSIENFDGMASGNMFTGLTCINDTQGNPHFFKVQQSKDNCFTTLHRVLHPTRTLADGNPDFLQKADIINDDDLKGIPVDSKGKPTWGDATKTAKDSQGNPILKDICSSDGLFTSYISKKIGDGNSKIGKLNKLGAWQEQECDSSQLNDTTHECNNILALINNDNLIIDNSVPCTACCNVKFGSAAKWCGNYNNQTKGVAAYRDNGDKKFKSAVHNLNSKISCQQQRLNQAGSIPQFFTDSNGKYFCLKDGGIRTTDSKDKSPMCINPSNSSNQPYPAIIDNGNISCTNAGDFVVDGDKYCLGNPLFDWKEGSIINKAINNNDKCYNADGTLNVNYKPPRGQSCIKTPSINKDYLTYQANKKEWEKLNIGMPIPTKQTDEYNKWVTDKQTTLQNSTKIIDNINIPWHSTYVTGVKGILSCPTLPSCN